MTASAAFPVDIGDADADDAAVPWPAPGFPVVLAEGPVAAAEEELDEEGNPCGVPGMLDFGVVNFIVENDAGTGAGLPPNGRE